MKRTAQKALIPMREVLTKYVLEDKGGYISREWQDYGYRLACEMGEEGRKSMYIKLAKTWDRADLEKARSFVSDAKNIKNRGRLFMWALGRIKKGQALTPVNVL